MLYEVRYTGTDGTYTGKNTETVEADSIPEAIVKWNQMHLATAGQNDTEHYLVTPQAEPIKVVLRKAEPAPAPGSTLNLTTADLPPQA